jgi:hypothetical protein
MDHIYEVEAEVTAIATMRVRVYADSPEEALEAVKRGIDAVEFNGEAFLDLAMYDFDPEGEPVLIARNDTPAGPQPVERPPDSPEGFE